MCVENVLRNGFYRYSHVFVSAHGSIGIKIFYIDVHKTCVFDGDDRFEKDFDGCEIGGGGIHYAGVIDEVATDCPSDAIRVRFLGAKRRNDTEIGSFTTIWEMGWINEVHYFGTFCGIARRPLKRRVAPVLHPYTQCAASSPVRNSLYACNRRVVGWSTALIASVSFGGYWYFLLRMQMLVKQRVGMMMFLASRF